MTFQIHSYSLGYLSSTNDIFPFVLDRMEQKILDEWTFLQLSKEDTFQKNINFVAYQVLLTSIYMKLLPSILTLMFTISIILLIVLIVNSFESII